MISGKCTEKDLSRELAEFRDQFPKLHNDQLFVLWFLRAFVTEDTDEAKKGLCGGSADKGVDAVLIDDSAKVVFVTQGKYRQRIGAKAESRSDVMSFAQLARDISGDGKDFTSVTERMSPEVRRRLTEARNRILKRGYKLQLHYVTTGRCSSSLEDEARRYVRSGEREAVLEVVDGKQVMLLLTDYLDGVAPPVPSLDLEIEAGRGVTGSGVFQRYDGRTEIESWVFSMTDQAIGALFERAGTRLFARNVRGFLGSTEINRGMEATLAREPDYFWYYNNGVTIVCDEATRESSRGWDILRVANPQVINGQQTTRTLTHSARTTPRASVLVRVIRIPRDDAGKGQSNHFDALVSQIVSATNWQNAIRPSDLMSNDRRQIEIERQLRKLGYWYVRKRQTKGEAKRAAGSQHFYVVKKDELAQAVAACELDPSIVRSEGKEGLFDERWYRQIFPTGEPNYYLTRYRLMREVSYSAKGYPERAYAKWLVLHFMWSRLAPLVRSRAAQEAFRAACEKNLRPLGPLYQANNLAFRAARRFFRLKRKGKGERAPDVSSFFKRRGLHTEYERFWASSSNPMRNPFKLQWKRFEKALREQASA